MYRFLLRPKWIAFHLLIVATVVTMVSLALWQLRRLDERKSFNARVEQNLDAAIEPLAGVLTDGVDQSSIEWRQVGVTGTYLAGQTVLVVNRSQGGESGRNVVDALQLTDGTVILVNRGFVPQEDAVPPAPSGRVEVIGRLRRSEVRRTGQPEDPSGVVLTEVRRIDIDKLAPQVSAATGTDVLPMYLERVTSDPADGTAVDETGQDPPLPIALPELGEGPHLSYTIQWFIFSACVIAGWVFAVRRSAATRSGVVRKRRGPPPILEP